MPSTTTSGSTGGHVPALTEALADLPPRVRVHDLARRAGLSSKQAIDALAAAGVSVGSASSSIDRDVAEALLTSLLGGAVGAVGAAGNAGNRRRADQPSRAGKRADQAAQPDNPARAATKGGRAENTRRDRAAAAKGAGDQPALSAEIPADNAPAARKGRAAKPATAAEPVADHARAAESPDGTAPGRQGAARRGRGRSATGSGAPAEAPDAASPATAEVQQHEGTGQQDRHDEGGDGESGHGRRRRRGGRGRRSGRGGSDTLDGAVDASLPGPSEAHADGTEPAAEPAAESAAAADGVEVAEVAELAEPSPATGRRRARGARREPAGGHDTDREDHEDTASEADVDAEAEDGDDEGSSSRRRRRRRRRRSGSAGGAEGALDEDEPARRSSTDVSTAGAVQGVRGSTRLEAKRQRRRDSRDSRRRPQILSEAEFLARRESVDRVMAVRQRGDLAQVALLEDGVLVEHFVSRSGSASMIGNVYLGRVQNVLPSMEAAFVDIGKGRNAVLYAGEVNWDIAGLEGKERRIETALSSGDTVLVQVSKDPIGHKGARLTTQISLPGRFLVFVPGGGATGISRKLPDTERKRLKKILDKIVPPEAGVIIRTAAEGVGEDDLTADVARLQAQWAEISAAAEKATKAAKASNSSAPAQLYAEPDTLIKVIRDLFNSDIHRLLVDGDDAWASLSEYVLAVAPELADRVSRYVGDKDVFAEFRIDEQIAKALERKVRLPSGGSLVIDRTEAMTVIDVNTGKFTGSGGNLEETVTRNNLEAAEEIVRQLRLRDIGGIIVVDFIDMVLESNRELVLRRLTECLGRDRTRHQVAEVTSLGLVQMTRKRMGLGLVEAFSEPCATCNGRGIVLHDTPSDISDADSDAEIGTGRTARRGRKRGNQQDDRDTAARFEPLVVERVTADAKPDPRGPRPPVSFRTEDGAVHDLVHGGAGQAAHRAADRAAQMTMFSGSDLDATAAPEGAVPEPAMPETAASDTAVPTTVPVETVPVTAVLVETAPMEDAAPKKPVRRRRAAGRPAGAPATAAAVVDIVLPTPAG
jgi:ribonuclease E